MATTPNVLKNKLPTVVTNNRIDGQLKRTKRNKQACDCFPAFRIFYKSSFASKMFLKEEK